LGYLRGFDEIELGTSVVDTFNVVNDRLAFRNYLNMFVTVWMGVLDLRTGEVEFVCAGHNPLQAPDAQAESG